MIIGGQLVKGDDNSFAVLNSTTEEPVAYCPQASVEQLDHTVAAAQSAFEQWRYNNASERQKLLNAIADSIEQHIDELAKVITEEQGKPIGLAQFEVQGAIAKQQVVGSGFEKNVTFGPMQNRNQFNIVIELVKDAKANGAKVLTGGEPLDRKGYFYPPTIVSEISDGTRLIDEEQFGPVLPIIRYHDVEERLQRSNANHSGLWADQF